MNALPDLSKAPPEVRAEAERVWRFLDELAQKDPAAYRKYVQEQAQQAKTEFTKEAQAAHAELEEERRQQAQRDLLRETDDAAAAAAAAEREPVFPTPGFVVLAPVSRCTEAWKHDESIDELYLNVCGHEEVPPPQDLRTGRPAPEDVLVSSQLGIPVHVEPARRLRKPVICTTADVCLHPAAIARCARDLSFKTHVIELALQFAEEELGVVLMRSYRLLDEIEYQGVPPHVQYAEYQAAKARRKEQRRAQAVAAAKAAERVEAMTKAAAATEGSSSSTASSDILLRPQDEEHEEHAPRIDTSSLRILGDEDDAKPSAAPLVQEYDPEAEAAAAAAAAGPPAGGVRVPEYTMSMKGDKVVVKVDLPEVESVSQLNIDMTPSTLKLTGAGVALEVEFPVPLDVRKTKATFVRKKHRLKVRGPKA